MEFELLPDAESVAVRAAAVIAAEARIAVEKRGRFSLAVSGGQTPWIMLEKLAGLDVPWEKVQLFQVDERIAPDGDAARNFTHLAESLLVKVPLPPQQIHAMPVTQPGLQAAALAYAAVMKSLLGEPAVLDVVHLGLGADGHTASLLPGDPALNVSDSDVAITGEYQAHRRMTLTYPALNRARRILWVVTGSEKSSALAHLRSGDPTIPAGRIAREQSLILADKASAS